MVDVDRGFLDKTAESTKEKHTYNKGPIYRIYENSCLLINRQKSEHFIKKNVRIPKIHEKLNMKN